MNFNIWENVFVTRISLDEILSEDSLNRVSLFYASRLKELYPDLYADFTEEELASAIKSAILSGIGKNLERIIHREVINHVLSEDGDNGRAYLFRGRNSKYKNRDIFIIAKQGFGIPEFNDDVNKFKDYLKRFGVEELRKVDIRQLIDLDEFNNILSKIKERKIVIMEAERRRKELERIV